MSIGEELARIGTPAVRRAAPSRVVSPLSDTDEPDDDLPQAATIRRPVTPAPLTERILGLLRAHAFLKTWEITEKLRLPLDEVNKALEVLKVDKKVVGVRGRGFRLRKAIDESVHTPVARDEEDEPEQPDTSKLAQLVLDKITEEPGTWTTQKIAGRLSVPVFQIQLVLEDLKSKGRVVAKQGGWLHPTSTEKEPPPTRAAMNRQLPALPEHSPTAARFGMDDHGNLAISKGELGLQLDSVEIERLENFVRRSRPLWKGDE